MLHFYDGQIRKFLTQFVRVLSNFSIDLGKDGAGNQILRQVPVTYGDLTRQVANILKNNSENTLVSAPKIAAYITGLEYDRERMQNPYHVEKQHLVERDVGGDGNYTNNMGKGYTVEKVMPSPFRLNVAADIFTTNTDMKLQIMEQILYLFNPDFEVQKSDNYIDWTSLSYIELIGTTFSSRTIPVGAESNIDVAQMTFSMPIWLSPPVKISKLGVIQKIIMSIYDDDGGINKGLIDGSLLTRSYITPNNFGLLVRGNQLRLLGSTGITTSSGGDGFYTGAHASTTLDPFEQFGPPINWNILLTQYGKITNGITQLKLTQENGSEVCGTISVSPLDETILIFNIDTDTIPENSKLVSTVYTNPLTAPGTVKKIINPLTFDPGVPVAGDRYLITENIGFSKIIKIYKTEYRNPKTDVITNYVTVDSTKGLSKGQRIELADNIGNIAADTIYYIYSIVNDNTITISTQSPVSWTEAMTQVDAIKGPITATVGNQIGSTAWQSSAGDEFVASANDIIEWTGSKWEVILRPDGSTVTYQTNSNTGIQYKTNGYIWVKSYEGIYIAGKWTLVL